jgi:hypothetical protein
MTEDTDGLHGFWNNYGGVINDHKRQEKRSY